MSAIYDNWERLVAAVLKKQQLWELFHDYSRSPSILSQASSDLSLRSWSPLDDHLESDFANRWSSSSTYCTTPKLVVISDFSPAIDVKHVSPASFLLLGRGTFGSSYAAAMVNGVRIVVKRLNSVSISDRDFNRHMAMLGGVKHKNVAALRAYYSSEDEKLMLYDYYTKASVQTLLHGQNGGPPDTVHWFTRLIIAMDAARGITEIHKQNAGKLVHGNIRASNVFFSPDQYGFVTDFGITNMIETTFMPPAHCYAPEVKNTQSVSQASDVYSFGVLLLELLTRKPAVHVPGGPQAVDLVKLVTSVRSKARAAKVFDAYLLLIPSIRDEAVKMLKIGMMCIEKSAKKRPKISQVLKMLEDISVISFNRTPEPRKLVFFEDANSTFDLDDLLYWAHAEELGKGTFGSSYKATLNNGITVMVKMLKHRVSTFEDFPYHMAVIGRVRHGNIARVRAYYFNEDEMLLVYDYYNEGSVYALLPQPDKIGTGSRAALVWESRLQIAVGAAKAIAHIHTQDGQKFVHGNIKSSNIFLYKQKYVIVSDVGLAQLSEPVSRSNILNPGYCAPEVTDTSRVTQASDIYSFGVVLLELLSGKRSQTTTGDGEVSSLVDWFQSIDRSEWTAKAFDLELLSYENGEDMMVRLGQIAMDCVSTYPEHRPRMSQVVKMLEEFSGVEPQSSLEDRWEEASIESRLEYLLEGLLPTLAP